ncbi:MAG: SMI1/KNR4 family protein [Planctomycetales bacterium]|nr:SMI1/KNR4 family protein [Planctomycetales bacterium]MBN8628242.1 SMI1/KNR4 family protein [Planctomycetota bacterium]
MKLHTSAKRKLRLCLLIAVAAFCGCFDGKQPTSPVEAAIDHVALKRVADRIQDAYEPLTRESISEIERTIKHRLPADYVAFLLMKNGGKLRDDWCCPLDDRRGPLSACTPQEFFPISEEAEDDNLLVVREDYDDRFHEWHLPIGREYNNLIVLSLRDDSFGQVFLWDFDADTMHLAPLGANLYRIADSFSEFLARLRYDPSESITVEKLPQFLAAEASDLAVLEKFIKSDSDFRHFNERGQTLLHVAVWHSQIDAVQLLLRNTFPVDAPNSEGLTALYYASMAGDIDIAKELLKSGANPRAKGKSGQSPLSEAMSNPYNQRMQRLLNSVK